MAIKKKAVKKTVTKKTPVKLVFLNYKGVILKEYSYSKFQNSNFSAKGCINMHVFS